MIRKSGNRFSDKIMPLAKTRTQPIRLETVARFAAPRCRKRQEANVKSTPLERLVDNAATPQSQNGHAPRLLRRRCSCPPRASHATSPRDHSSAASNVSQLETAPDFNPFENQRVRCAEEPWVNLRLALSRGKTQIRETCPPRDDPAPRDRAKRFCRRWYPVRAASWPKAHSAAQLPFPPLFRLRSMTARKTTAKPALQ